MGAPPMVPGPLITVGPTSMIDGELMMMDPGVITIELAPQMSVIITSAVTVRFTLTVKESFADIVTLRFMSTVKESFVVTVTDRLFPTVRV
jgi:hypothetical protein